MYTQFFHLKQPPFSIAPDPRYLFMSERHREALAHLLYGVGSGGGFVLLTGEIGAGKTTVCRCFMEQVPAHCKIAYIFNPKLSVEDLLSSICDEFGIAQEGSSVKAHVDAINAYLLTSHAQSRNNVLIIDEAQNLSGDVLEQLRLLTNLETSERKLLQIILIGQPELRTMLARPELEQLAQRVIARYHLGALAQGEVGSYIAHRLAVAGSSAALFPPSLLGQIHRISKGVPRRINLLCDRALLGAYVENRPQVTPTILRRAGAEVFGTTASGPGARRMSAWVWALVGVAAGALISGAAFWFAAQATDAPAPVSAEVAAIAQTDPDLRALATLWGAVLPEGEPCQEAIKLDLRCHIGKGGLAELRLLDRPALLTELGVGGSDAVSHALLTGLSATQAKLQVAGQEQGISLAALRARFGDEFVTLWRAPSHWRSEIALGDRGPDVDWLASRLAHWDGTAVAAQNRPFNAALQARLRAFQSSQQLNPDGVAGPRTLIRLVRQGGAAEPRLLDPSAPVAGK
jgi:general secretion pathway protein A